MSSYAATNGEWSRPSGTPQPRSKLCSEPPARIGFQGSAYCATCTMPVWSHWRWIATTLRPPTMALRSHRARRRIHHLCPLPRRSPLPTPYRQSRHSLPRFRRMPSHRCPTMLTTKGTPRRPAWPKSPSLRHPERSWIDEAHRTLNGRASLSSGSSVGSVGQAGTALVAVVNHSHHHNDNHDADDDADKADDDTGQCHSPTLLRPIRLFDLGAGDEAEEDGQNRTHSVDPKEE